MLTKLTMFIHCRYFSHFILSSNFVYYGAACGNWGVYFGFFAVLLFGLVWFWPYSCLFVSFKKIFFLYLYNAFLWFWFGGNTQEEQKNLLIQLYVKRYGKYKRGRLWLRGTLILSRHIREESNQPNQKELYLQNKFLKLEPTWNV